MLSARHTFTSAKLFTKVSPEFVNERQGGLHDRPILSQSERRNLATFILRGRHVVLESVTGLHATSSTPSQGLVGDV